MLVNPILSFKSSENQRNSLASLPALLKRSKLIKGTQSSWSWNSSEVLLLKWIHVLTDTGLSFTTASRLQSCPSVWFFSHLARFINWTIFQMWLFEFLLNVKYMQTVECLYCFWWYRRMRQRKTIKHLLPNCLFCLRSPGCKRKSPQRFKLVNIC